MNLVQQLPPFPHDQLPSTVAQSAAKRARRIATAPVSCRKVLIDSWSQKCAPRRAIKAFCLECVGFERVAITECSSFACPLWNFRPYRKP